MKRGVLDCPVRKVPAAEIEKIIIDQIRALLRTPEVIIQTWRAARKVRSVLSEDGVRGALVGFDELWAELFPAE